MKIKRLFEKREEISKNGVANSNLFIFEGPPGVGKTHTAIALAGELEIPFIKIGANEIYSQRVGFKRIFEKIRRFRNTVVLVDDVDKVMEGGALSFDDGGIINSEFNSYLDESEKSALILFSVNDSNRLGKALKDRFEIIKMDNPNGSQRKMYFESLFKKANIRFNVLPEEIARITDGMNYRALKRFWDSCILFAIENKLDVLDSSHLSMISLPEKKEIKSRSYF